MKLIEAAERLQDLYYQNFPPNDKFIDIDDFIFQVATSYSSLLNAMYQQERKMNKQMEGFSNIEIPAAWMIEEDLIVEFNEIEERYFSTLSQPVFSFDWDNAANALQGVHSIGKPHRLYRKISLNERRFRQIIPPISATLFYLDKPKEIIFWDAQEGARVKVQYVPQVVGQENDCILSDNIFTTLQPVVLDAMFKAKNGNFVQKADDQNPNINPGQQDNPALQGGK